ncbi:MAG: class I SAM-dependent methyltransferase [Acidobacteria bacterium]|nr:class I SAM-dependent methyltransferase [Acidobacteriota bacterium]
MRLRIDFGYPAFVIYGHLLVTLVALPLALLAYRRKWSRWILLPTLLVTIWSLASFALIRFGLDLNGRTTLPTNSFLASGAGRVLDMGAGSGRSAIMVLEARPQATLVALDLFGEEYDHHFGASQDSQMVGRARLLSNFRAANVESRATIVAGDMRQMPLEPASFDAIVSSYAIDHLNSKGIQQSLAEANRVLKPNGEFLLMVISKDAWMNFTWGPVFFHGGTRPATRWTQLLNEANFDVPEQGTKPATLYFLARKR